MKTLTALPTAVLHRPSGGRRFDSYQAHYAARGNSTRNVVPVPSLLGFGALQAVDGVSFAVPAGETVESLMAEIESRTKRINGKTIICCEE